MAVSFVGSYFLMKSKAIHVLGYYLYLGKPFSYWLSTEDFVSDVSHRWLVIIHLHALYGALQLFRQFREKTAHVESEFHADGLDAGRFLDAGHVLKTEIKEVGSQVLIIHLQSFDDAQCQPS